MSGPSIINHQILTKIFYNEVLIGITIPSVYYCVNYMQQQLPLYNCLL
jgi:hypothetical protein